MYCFIEIVSEMELLLCPVEGIVLHLKSPFGNAPLNRDSLVRKELGFSLARVSAPFIRRPRRAKGRASHAYLLKPFPRRRSCLF